MPAPSPGLWFVTILILVVGGLTVWWLGERAELGRVATMERVAIGARAADVTTRLDSEPLRCPGDDLEHLAASFPEDWTSSTVSTAIRALEERTEERWVYGMGRRTPELCGGDEERTEIGVDGDGGVVWVLPLLGRSRIRLPELGAPTAGGS